MIWSNGHSLPWAFFGGSLKVISIVYIFPYLCFDWVSKCFHLFFISFSWDIVPALIPPSDDSPSQGSFPYLACWLWSAWIGEGEIKLSIGWIANPASFLIPFWLSVFPQSLSLPPVFLSFPSVSCACVTSWRFWCFGSVHQWWRLFVTVLLISLHSFPSLLCALLCPVS